MAESRARRILGAPLRVDRSAYLVGAGALVLCASSLLPWVEVPSSAASSVDASGALLVEAPATSAELVWRLLFLCAGLLIGLRITSHLGRATRRIAWGLLGLLIAFPCWFHLTAPETARDAGLLHGEMELAIHRLEYGLSNEQVDWRRWEPFASPLLSKHRLVTRPLMRFPEPQRFSVTRFLPVHWHLLLADPLGYSVPFLAHVRPGMLAAWLGVVLVLMGLVSDPRLGLAAARRGLALSGLAALVALACPLFLRGMSERHLLGADEATLAGADRAALQHLRRASAWYPPLQDSWTHRAAIGRALRRLGVEADPEALCAVAQESLAERRPLDALTALRHASASERGAGAPLPPFFLGFTLVEAGINSYAAGQYGSAARHWEEALQILPTDPLPWCGLALVHLRHGDAKRAARCLDRVSSLQSYLGFKRLTLRSQAHVLWSWAELQQGDLESAHEHFSASLRPDMW